MSLGHPAFVSLAEIVGEAEREVEGIWMMHLVLQWMTTLLYGLNRYYYFYCLRFSSSYSSKNALRKIQVEVDLPNIYARASNISFMHAGKTKIPFLKDTN